MPSTRTRTAKVEQSVTTRSRAQNRNNVIEDVTKSTEKIGQRKRKGKSSNVKEKLEINVKKNSLDTKETFSRSVKKQVSRRKLNLETEAHVKSVAQENENTDFKQLISNDKCSSNISITECVINDISQFNILRSINSNKKYERKIIDADVKTSPITVTPKNTPPKLSLTPHRSKKTPKKSPISLDSPKTHSLAVPKLLKSPRKLSLISVSEENTNKSDNDDRKSQRTKKDRFSNISISNKSLSTSSAQTHKKSSINLKSIASRFSKSPKIILKSPKSKKSKSSKMKLLFPSPVRKSLVKNVSITSTSFMSDLDKEKNILAMKHRLLKKTRLKNILTASQLKDVLTEPVVLLERLPFKILQNMLTIARETKSDTLTNTRNSFKKLTSRTRIGSDMSTKRNSSINLRNNNERSVNNVSLRIKHNTSIQEKDRSSVSLMSSTPREKKKSMNMSLISNTPMVSTANTSRNTSSKRRKSNQSNVQLCSIMNNSKTIENISQYSLFDVSDISQSHLSNAMKWDVIFDKNSVTMQKNKTNDTYELEQPQTLNLRQMIRKRTSVDANLSSKEDVKRVKVHFANLISDKSMHKSTNKSTKSQSRISHNVSLQRNNMNSARKLRKIETPKFNRNSLITPIKTKSSLKTNGVTSKIQLNKNQITPINFASIEKKSAKKSSTKKVPNFGRIHEKMFAKSESLVDAKKRLESRHLAFTADKAFSKVDVKKDEKKPLPTDTKDGTHNRFGFKLRKAEATHIILKKQTVFSRQKQQHETRMTLKGVRTNRRFELQMKARNANA